MTVSVTLLPGDGIGPEIMSAAVDVITHVANRYNVSFKFTEKPVGGTSIEQNGQPLTNDTLQACFESDAVLLGAVGGIQWENLPHRNKPEAGLLKLRKELDLFANYRPVKVYPAFFSASPLKEEILEHVDLVIVRELTGGIYFGEPRGFDKNRGWNTMVYTRPEIERIARMAFELARQRNGSLVSVDKANVLECSQFWRSVVYNIHSDFEDVELKYMYVDNAAMQLIRDPGQFDVILTSNMFGDILSDIGGVITGSLGMLPSASLGKKYALYEPVHGSAPDLAGKNSANPIAMIASAALMFSHSFQMTQAAQIIEESIQRTLKAGYRTQDIFQPGNTLVSTTEMTSAIIKQIEQILNEQAIGVFTL